MDNCKRKKLETEVTLLKKIEIKPIYSQIAKKYSIDYRTVKKVYEGGYEEKRARKKRVSS